jgi:hypothetical protein
MNDHQLSTRPAVLELTRSLVTGIRPGRRRPLPRLADVHPGTPAGGRWIGLQTVPTAHIRGTASSASRGQDFRPLDGHKPADWTSRWSRLMSAGHDLTSLPPIALVRAGGDYWVLDGHNRVALAKEFGQLWIDAEVTELDLSSRTPVSTTAAKEN